MSAIGERNPGQGAAGWLLKAVAVVAAAMALAACVVYEPVPAYQPPSVFERSWAAAIGALQDQGVVISGQDRATGTVRGSRGAVNVVANVRTQADGSVRVEFNSSGAIASDPDLVNRISGSYNRRMGR
jgi:hypothetical protein